MFQLIGETSVTQVPTGIKRNNADVMKDIVSGEEKWTDERGEERGPVSSKTGQFKFITNRISTFKSNLYL